MRIEILSKPVVDPNLCTNSVLRRAARNMGQLYDDVLSPSGLKGTQFTCLPILSH